jgi:hypothetical protein
MANPGHLILTKIASGAVGGRRIVKFGAADNLAAVATAATDLAIGVSDRIVDAADGDTVDVIIDGSAEVVAGGTIARGASVTAGAAGVAVAAATGNIAIGYALASAVAGDFVDVALSRHTAA